jgi:tRNA 2-thiocytidine biosynthesis protein TtcA
MSRSCETILVLEPKSPLTDIEQSLRTTYKKDLFNPFVKAIKQYEPFRTW